MTPHLFVAMLAVAAAVLALWLDQRFPAVGPGSVGGGVLAIVVTGIVLQLSLPLASFLIGRPSLALAVTGVLGVTLPALCIAFLSAIWLIKAAAATLGGGAR